MGAAPAGGGPDAVADRGGQSDQCGGLWLGGQRVRPVAGRAGHRVPAVAAPGRVRRWPDVAGYCRDPGLLRAVAATAVRRAGYYWLDRVCGRVAAGGGAHVLPDGRRLLPGGAGLRPLPAPRRRWPPWWPCSSLARLYLGVEYPDDALLGAAFAVAIAVTAFRYFTPNEVFPVAYRRGRTAHVDVTGRGGRRSAGRALQLRAGGDRDQAGRSGVVGGLDAAAAADRGRRRQVPVREAVRQGHVRADRWYKLGRTILYAPWRMSLPSRACGGWPNTRTMPSICCRRSGSHGQAPRHRGNYSRA